MSTIVRWGWCWNHGGISYGDLRTEDEARAKHRREGRGRVCCIELRLNPRLAANFERVDAAIVEISEIGFTARGTARELLELGLAEPYMFETLAKSRTRSSSDDMGCWYRVAPVTDGFEVKRTMSEEAQQPYKRKDRAPLIDVEQLLVRFRRGVTRGEPS